MRAVLVGEYIKSHREKQGITQEELCAGICSKSTLSRLERGKQTPGRDKLYALLHRLGLPEDRVFVVVSEHDVEIQKLKKSMSNPFPAVIFIHCHGINENNTSGHLIWTFDMSVHNK